MMESRIFFLLLGAVLLAQVCPSSQVPKIVMVFHIEALALNFDSHDQSIAATAIDENVETNPNQHEEDDYYQEFLGVKGRPGIDFPNLAAIPITSFTCRNVKESGYFADMETKCQVFHICDGGRKMSFLCPNGTIFRQSHLICDWWFRVDCEDSQAYYEPSADTLRRDRERAKHDRMPSESRESMSITTDFRPHQQQPVYVSPKPHENNNFYMAGEPLHHANRRISTIQEHVLTEEERHGRLDQQRKPINQNSQFHQQRQQNVQDINNYQSDLGHKKIVANFRSVASNGYNSQDVTKPKLVIDDGIIRAAKQSEINLDPNLYFEPEDPIHKIPLNFNVNTKDVGINRNPSSAAPEESDIRRADKTRRIVRLKVKSSKKESSEGQILAETSSYAGSHRRGLTQDRRQESVTFSQVADNIRILEIPSKKDEEHSAVNNRPQNIVENLSIFKSPSVKPIDTVTPREEQINTPVPQNPKFDQDTDFIVTYRPPTQSGDSEPKTTLDSGVTSETSKYEEIETTNHPSLDDEVDSVVTYRPVMDLEKLLHQRREKLTKYDDDRDGKPYNGTRSPPNLPLSSGPGAIHSLALYIENQGGELLYNTPRRIHGSLKGIVPTDPIPVQTPRSPWHVERESIYSTQKQQARKQLPSTTEYPFDSVTSVEYTAPQSTSNSQNESNENELNTEKLPTSNKTDGNDYLDKELSGQHSPQRNAKDIGSISNKNTPSREEANNKKHDSIGKKMKEYLLGNFTSGDSGLFQHINKALKESNSSLTRETMEILFHNAIEPVLKEAMTLGSITESELAEILTTTEESVEDFTESPVTTENYDDESVTESEKDIEAIQITPFFKVENGKVSSTPVRFPEDKDITTTPSDLRELAQVFSRALSAYLEDPDTFREALASVSHPQNPITPIRLTSAIQDITSNSTEYKEEDDEVLDFSDVQTATTTTAPQYQYSTTAKVTPIQQTTTTTTASYYNTADSTSPKIHTGFYITIPFITPTHSTPDKSGKLSQKDAEGPDSGSVQTATTVAPEINTTPLAENASLTSNIEDRGKNGSQHNESSLPLDKGNNNESHQVLLTENFPPLQTKVLPPFQDEIPIHEGLGSNDEDNGFTDINIPTAALDEILNEFVPEELNRLAMTSIEPEEIPDDSKYLSAYTDSLEKNLLSTTDILRENISTTPSSFTTTTPSTTPSLDLASQTVNAILSRITSKLPQMTNSNRKPLVNSPVNAVPYDTYTNKLLKTVTTPETEKDESLIRAHSANFLPGLSGSGVYPKQNPETITELSTPPIEDSSSMPTEQYSNEKTTTLFSIDQDYELLPSSSVATPVRVNPPKKILNATEVLSLNGADEDEILQEGNPRLVLLFVNDRNAKGIGLTEKNARLLKALLRKDDHHILQSVGLIPDETNDTREPTTSTTTSKPNEKTSLPPPTRIIQKAPTTTLSSTGKENLEVRTEPPITTYAPKFTISWLPIKKVRSPSRNQTSKAEKIQATEPPKPVVESTTPINMGTSDAPKYLPEEQTTITLTNSSELLGDDKSTVSDGRAFDLLRSLYSLTARWG